MPQRVVAEINRDDGDERKANDGVGIVVEDEGDEFHQGSF